MKRKALFYFLPFKFYRLLAPLLAAWPLMPAAAQSSHTWNGGGASPLDWTDPTNWTGGVPDGNDLVNMAGAGGGSLTNVFSGFASQHRLFFNSGAGSYTLDGPAPVTFFDFGGNAPKIENNATGTTQALNFGVVLDGTAGGGYAEVNPVDGNLTLNSTLDLAGTTQLRVWGNNGNTLTVEGALSSSGNSGANTVAINQNSVLYLKGANTYTGDSFVNAGELRLGNSTQGAGAIRLGDTTGSANAAFSLTNSANGAGVTISNKALEVRAGSSGVKTIGNTGLISNTFGGAITLNNPLTLAPSAGSQLRLTGVISGAGQPITVSGQGLTVLGGVNTFTGQVTVKSGATLGLIPAAITLGTSSALGNTGTGNETIVESGGTLNIGGTQFGNRAPGEANNEIIRIAGSGVGGVGALINTSGQAGNNALSKVVLTGDATFSAGGNNQVSYGSGGNILSGVGRTDIRQSAAPTAGQAHLDLAGNTLTIAGNHLHAIVNSDVSSGNIIINAGQLNLEAGTLVQGTGYMQVNQGGKLGFWSQSAAGNISRPTWVNGGTIGDPTNTGAAQTVGVPIQIMGANNPNFTAISANVTTLSGVISQATAAAAATATTPAITPFTGTSLDKRGGGVLAFSNTANSFSTPVTIYAGTLRGVYSTTITGGVLPAAPATTTDTPLGTSNTITLAGGTLSLQANMANDATNQRWAHPAAITVDRAPSGITFDRIANATQTDKNVVFSSLTFAPRSAANGWSIGQNQLTFTQGNTHRLELSNVTINGDTNLVTGDFNITGNILAPGGHSLQKSGGNSWGVTGTGLTQEFNSVFITGSTATRVGSMYGTSDVSNTATLGTGPIHVGPNNAITFRSPTNLASGQIVEVRSQDQNMSTLQLEPAFTSVPANLRAAESGVLSLAGPSGISSIDLSRIGDGSWRIGSNIAGITGTGASYAGTFTPGNGNIVRLGGTNQGLTISGTNAISGNAALEVGSSIFNGSYRNFFNGTNQNGSTTIITGANNFTGPITVNRASQLVVDHASALGTGGAVSVWGTLNLRGVNASPVSLTTDGLVNNRSISVYGGSSIAFDQGLLTGAGSSNIWGDNESLALNGSGLLFISRNNGVGTTTENIGAVSVAGGSTITLNRFANNTSGHNIRLEMDSLSRVGQGQLELIRNTGTGAGWGAANGHQINITGTAPTVTNGMVAPWITMQNGSAINTFATYTGGGVFAAATLTSSNAAALPAGTGVENYDIVTTAASSATPVTYNAMRASIGTSGAGTINLRSGGLIFGAAVTVANPVTANNGTANTELVIHTSNVASTLSGLVTAASASKSGTGALTLTANNAIPGIFQINQGQVTSIGSGTSGANFSPLGTGQVILAGAGAQWNIRSNGTTGVANTLRNTGVSVAAGIPFGVLDVNRGDGSSTGITMTINPAAAGGSGLVLAGSPGEQGQMINVQGGNTYALTFGNNALNSITGNATLNTSSANLTLNNAPSVAALGGVAPVITKTGGNQLTLGVTAGSPSTAANTTWRLQGGTLELRSLTALGNGGAGGTGIELLGGTLNLRRDAAGTYGGGATTGYNTTVRGNSTISVDRVSTGNFNVGLGRLTMTNNGVLTVNHANNFGLFFEGGADLRGSGIIVSNITGVQTQDTALRLGGTNGTTSGGSLIKLGGGHLHLNGASATYDGGTFVNAGIVRLRAAGAAGTGAVTLNPGAILDFNAANNLNAGQQVIVNSTPAALAMISMNADVAHPTTGVDTTNAPTGIIGLSNSTAGTYDTAINLASLYGGRWSLGGVSQGAYDPRYTATSLGVGADNLYRLGGGGTSFFMGFSSAGAVQNNVLTGAANSARFGFDSGNIYTNGVPGNYQFVLGGSNDYGGTSVIHRGIAVRSFAAIDGSGNSAFGKGAVDVFGSLVLSGTGTLANSGGLATNALTLHPGSSLVLDNNGGSGQAGAPTANLANRIADGQALNLRGSLLDFIGNNNNPSAETLGTVSIGNGSRIRASRTGTGTTALTITNLAGTTTTGNSLLLQTSAAAQLGLPAGDRIIATNLGTVAMVDPRVVNYTDGMFVGHDAVNGFVNIVPTVVSGGTLTAGLAPSTNVSVTTAAATIADNAVVNSLATNQNINNGGPFNKITIRSGGLLASGATTIQPDLIFNDGTQNIEARVTASNTLNIQGQITANGFTKAGGGQVFIKVPQPNYASGWNVNSGDLIFDDPAAAGQSVSGNAITVTGSTSTGGVNTAAGFGNLLGSVLGSNSRVVFRYNNDSQENVTFTGGPITVVNDGGVQLTSNGASDRTITIPSVSITSDSTLSSAGVNFDVPNSRVRGIVPTLTLNSNATIRVTDSGSTGDYGRVTALAVNSLAGSSKNLIKIGNRALELRNDNSTTFTGGTINIGQGTVVVGHNGSLGSATTAATIERNATLEIATASYTPTGTVTQKPGSSERWDQQDARGTGTYNLPAGVNLQLAANLLAGPSTIGLNGGTIEAFGYTDSPNTAFQRDIKSSTTIKLLANSYLGQAVYLQGATYDTGRQPNVNAPFGENFQGGLLNIEGAITGNFDLTKTGHDTVRLAGSGSTYRSLSVDMGVVQLGANNSTAAASGLNTRLGGTFDLYGFNTTVGSLGTDGSYSGGGVGVGYSGRITNSGAVDLKTLTVNQSTATTYNGLIDQNVSLTKSGSGTLVLGNPDNAYRGTTTVSGGVLSVNKLTNGSTSGNTLTSGIGQSSSDAANLNFSGSGLLRYTGATASTDRQFTLGDGGGGFESSGSGPLTLSSTATVTQTGSAARTLILGGSNTGANTFAGVLANGPATTGLTKTGSGNWTLSGISTYSGTTSVQGGSLILTAAAGLPNTATVDIDAGATFDVTALSGGFNVDGKTVIVDGTFDGSIVNTGSGLVQGTGTITGTTTLTGGTVSPGNSPGVLTTSSVTATSTTFQFEIGGSSPGTQFDQIDTSGSILLSDSLLVVTLINGFIPNSLDTFDIWLNDGGDSVGGTFTGLPEGTQIDIPSTSGGPGGGLNWDYWIISYQGNTGNDIRLTYVPEPGTAALGAASLLLLARRRRR